MKVFYKILLFINAIIFCILVYNLDTKPKTYIKPDSFHTTLYIDYKFNEQEKQYIVRAAYNWEVATRRIATFNVVILPTREAIDLSKGILILKVDALDPEIILIDSDSGKPTTLGLCKNFKPVPYIKIVASRLSVGTYQTTVEHELGHLLGLKHTSDPNALMHPTLDYNAYTITDTDLVSFCKLYNCKSSKQ